MLTAIEIRRLAVEYEKNVPTGAHNVAQNAYFAGYMAAQGMFAIDVGSKPEPVTTGHGGYDVQQAAIEFERNAVPAISAGDSLGFCYKRDTVQDAFIAGASWQKDRIIATGCDVDSAAISAVELIRCGASDEFMKGDGPMVHAFMQGVCWQKGQTVPAVADANPDAAVMRKLDGIIDAVAGLNGTVGRMITHHDNLNNSVMGRLNQIEENTICIMGTWEDITPDGLQGLIVDVGQKVEAVLTQAVSNGELIEAVHGIAARPLHDVLAPDDEPMCTLDYAESLSSEREYWRNVANQRALEVNELRHKLERIKEAAKG